MQTQKIDKRDFPMKIKIGFNKVFEASRKQLELDDHNPLAKEILSLAEQYPQLSEGFDTAEELQKYSSQIDTVMQPLFPSVFFDNEVKFATVPFRNIAFKSTARYDELILAAGKNFNPEFNTFRDYDFDEFYIMACSLIASHYYGRDLDVQLDFHCSIPDGNGLDRDYRVLYNTDFIEINKNPKTPELTDDDFIELLENYEDVGLWKKKFPPLGYTFNGFLIAHLIDITSDLSISEFKTDLLRLEINKGVKNDFTPIFKSIFGLNDLRIGFSNCNEEEETLEKVLFKEIDSFLLLDEKCVNCKDALCSTSYYTLFKQKEFYVITDVERYQKQYPQNPLYKKLKDQGIGSAIFASIVSGGRILGVLELVSNQKNKLNTINANRLWDIMPFFVDSVLRAKINFENELELIVQEECTSIHNSVHWKFKNEARRYLESINEGAPAIFREIVFHHVHPLYGQVDIKGSSDARNEATKKDLREQLEHVSEIIRKLNLLEPLPIYDQMNFAIGNFTEEICDNLQVDTERKIVAFLSSEIIPFFRHLSQTNEEFKKLVTDYNKLIDTNTGLVYKHRKDYDESVMQVNKILAGVIDKKQLTAQRMFPHYFERFKTDGVEHNLYIGASLTRKKAFDPIYLKNLKLWQLQVICEMENTYHRFKDQLPVPLEVASMILAFNGSLSLRFRLDEKRFDVDGTYNARYEVVKKRVDKAHIKGTEERLTQPGKLTIVYSQKEDGQEYSAYIKFLQSLQLLDNDKEIVEIEDLQGVTGLKAIRVSFLYSEKNEKEKAYYTYEDLISEVYE